MRAALLSQPGKFEIKEISPPSVQQHQIKIKVEGCGICSSSIPLWQGRDWFNYPQEPGSPGHEGWGIVESLGDNIENFKKGDKVAFLSYHAYADYEVVDQANVIKLPQSLNNLPFPGEPLGCAMNIFDRSDISEKDTVAIIGIGFLGALLCQLCKQKGAKVVAISKRQFSLEYATTYGADENIAITTTWEIAGKVKEITRGSFCSRVIEATGKQEALDIAIDIIAEGGKLIVAGYHQDGMRQVDFQKWNWKGIDVINAHERNPEKYKAGIKNAVDAVASGTLKPELLYTHTFNIEEINKGFEIADTRPEGFMKALIINN
jgi:threonine dehydrogenase-like Zn-dependent dehydrogenase